METPMATPAFSRGDYFAEGDYLSPDPATGAPRDRAGAAVLALPDGLLGSLHDVLAAECGPAGGRILGAAGRDWGRAFAARFDRDLSDYHGAPLAEWPFARFQACVTSALAHLGWGRAELDTSRFDQGVLTVAVHNPIPASPGGPPATGLLAGVLAGMFSAFTGQELAALPT